MEQHYGHVTTIQTVADAADQAVAWLRTDDLTERGRRIHERLVAQCDDPVDFMLQVVRRYAPGGC
jgi:hypothetical protein